MTWRYIAQRISGPLKGQFLDWNVPLSNVGVTSALGSNWLSGTINPAYLHAVQADGAALLDKWSTAIWAEQDGVIRGGGIVVSNAFSGPVRQIECMGYAGYPTGMPYVGYYSQVKVDPLDVVRHIWNHLQSYGSGDLDMVVDSTKSPVRLGTPKTAESGSGPYTLAWWEEPDCGETISSLAQDTPFEYREEHGWNADKSAIIHRLRLGYPRLGNRRHDLRFVLGENLLSAPDFADDGTEFANTIHVLGAGSGRTTLRSTRPSNDHRVRRIAVVTNKTLKTQAQLDALAASEQAARARVVSVKTVEIQNHPNATVGSWSAGDEVLIQAHTDWAKLRLWCRIISTTVYPDNAGRVSLTLERS